MDVSTRKRKILCIPDLSHSTIIILAILTWILALTFYLRLCSFGQYIDADVGNIGYLAWRMAEGEILIDLEGPGKPPLYFMLYAVFISLFGLSPFGLKIFGAFFALAAILAVYWVAREAYGSSVGLLAALLFGVFSSAPMVEGGTVNLETVMHLPYVLTIGLMIKGSVSGRQRWYFLAGLCAALSTLIKQVGGVLFFVFLCNMVWEWWRERRFPFQRYAVLAGGAFLPVFGMIIFYHLQGYTLNELYHSMLGSNFRYLQKGYEYTSFLKSFLRSMRFILPENGLLWLGTIFATAHIGWQIFQGKGRVVDQLLLWWTFWSFAVLWVSGTFYSHYFLQIIPAFSVLTAYGIVRSWRLLRLPSVFSRSVAQGAWAIILLVLILIFVRSDHRYFFSYTPVEQTIFQHKILGGYGVYNVAMQEIASYIRARTNPSETVYVWGIAPQIYFLAQRKASTKYRNNYNLSQFVTDNLAAALRAYAPIVMEEIKRSAPAYIVQIFRLESFPELHAFVQDHYTIDENMTFFFPPHRIRLYQRRQAIQTDQNPK
jgi:4-amino-4-deoxy-L-arabinose transferase-like glycosyltransferase